MTNSKRQPYGFGSFVKKFTKPIKKIAKSKLGKAALLGGGLYGVGSLMGGGGGWGNFAKLGSKIGGAFGKKRLLGNLIYSGKGADRKLSLGKMGLMGLLGAGTVLPFLGGDDEEEVIETPWETTPSSIANITAMARARDPSLSFLPSNAYTQSGFYAADGGLARLANGGGVAEAQAEQMLKMEYQKYRNQGGTMSYQRFKMMVLQQAQGQGPMAQGQPQMAPQMAAHGGRIGFWPGGPAGGASAGGNYGGDSSGGDYQGAGAGRSVAQGGQFGRSYSDREGFIDPVGAASINVADGAGITSNNQVPLSTLDKMKSLWSGLRSTTSSPEEEDDVVNYGKAISDEQSLYGKALSSAEKNAADAAALKERFKDLSHGGRVGRAEGGIMDLGGMEKDYRQEGGFVPLGKEEKADDVPARLSKNEFVFTADAVKAAGGGDIDAGAEVMQNMMNNLEEGGEISEESQGAQGMYNQQQMLQSRMA